MANSLKAKAHSKSVGVPDQGIWAEIRENPDQFAIMVFLLAIIVLVRIWVRKKFLPAQRLKQRMESKRLMEINIYPVKSCAGISLQKCKIGKFGLENDRKWMVVSTTNKRFITQRQYPRMALIKPNFDEKDFLTLNAPDMPSLKIPTGKNRRNGPVLHELGVWKSIVDGVDEGDKAADWFQKFLEVPDLRLVRIPDDHNRSISEKFHIQDQKFGNVVSYADGFPFLLIANGSLQVLNKEVQNNPNAKSKDELIMKRFRPNFVVEAEGFVEDTWKKIQMGSVIMNVVKPCTRCKLTTVNPETGEFQSEEPLNTLQTFRTGVYKSSPEQVCFGQNLIHESEGEVEVGMLVNILEFKDTSKKDD